MRGLIPPPNCPNSSEQPPLPSHFIVSRLCPVLPSLSQGIIYMLAAHTLGPISFSFFFLFFRGLSKTGQEAGSQVLFGKLKEDVTCSSVHRQSVYGYRYQTICSGDAFYTPGFSRRASLSPTNDLFFSHRWRFSILNIFANSQKDDKQLAIIHKLTWYAWYNWKEWRTCARPGMVLQVYCIIAVEDQLRHGGFKRI